jgi:hypothetical protein
MTNCCGWFIHPATEISKNRNGSRTLCVFKTHYREPGIETLEAYQSDRVFGRYDMRALALVTNDSERRFLERRLREVQTA